MDGEFEDQLAWEFCTFSSGALGPAVRGEECEGCPGVRGCCQGRVGTGGGGDEILL